MQNLDVKVMIKILPLSWNLSILFSSRGRSGSGQDPLLRKIQLESCSLFLSPTPQQTLISLSPSFIFFFLLPLLSSCYGNHADLSLQNSLRPGEQQGGVQFTVYSTSGDYLKGNLSKDCVNNQFILE